MPGRTADAIDELKSAIRLRPDYPEAHFLLGMVLLRDPKERDAAIAHLRRSLELRPDFDLARKELERLGAPGP
jgi:tetratricopeptide (TPR) repeat protein